MAEIVKDDIIMYNSFVVDLFNLTEKDVEMSRDEFCKAVAKICDKTWVFPSEFKTTPTKETKVNCTLSNEFSFLFFIKFSIIYLDLITDCQFFQLRCIYFSDNRNSSQRP